VVEKVVNRLTPTVGIWVASCARPG